jgi:hypothetical protein
MQARNWLLARVAEWQTRRTQNPLFERTCGFDSHLGHVLAQVTLLMAHRHLCGHCGSRNLYTPCVASMFLERRLAQIGTRLRVTQEKLRIAEEQCSAMEEETNEHELRSLVSETAGASYEFRQAKAHSDALKRHCEELRSSIREMEVRQDELLDKLSKTRRKGEK